MLPKLQNENREDRVSKPSPSPLATGRVPTGAAGMGIMMERNRIEQAPPVVAVDGGKRPRQILTKIDLVEYLMGS